MIAVDCSAIRVLPERGVVAGLLWLDRARLTAGRLRAASDRVRGCCGRYSPLPRHALPPDANDRGAGKAHLNREVVYTSRGKEGRSWWGPGDLYTFLVTGEESGGSLFALDCLVGVGGGPPPHRHLAEDELFAITAGSIRFTTDGESRSVSAGQSVFVPCGTAHFYRNDGTTPARMIAVYTPAGMEGWFREVCTPVDDPSRPPPPITDELIERMLEAGPRYNVEWVD